MIQFKPGAEPQFLPCGLSTLSSVGWTPEGELAWLEAPLSEALPRAKDFGERRICKIARDECVSLFAFSTFFLLCILSILCLLDS